MTKKDKEEYYFLIEKLDGVEWALKGECNDIDCDKYMHKNLLKKKYKPVLEHNYSCMKKLKLEKEAILRLLSQKKYDKYRYVKCNVCKKSLDKLSNKAVIVPFTQESEFKGKKCFKWESVWVHKKCQSKVKIPEGWKKFN